VRLLLDTHALLWALAIPEKLPATARRAIQSADNEVYASVASAWEMSIEIALGKLDFEVASLERALAASGIQLLGIDLKHTARLATLPHHHRDPFDRLLVAQAISESMTLVTRDAELAGYGVRLLWREAAARKRGPRRAGA
jgi:PIN domain nuclease of toxin-antitoxin system